MAKRGPKLIQIDQTQFEKLCGIQCTLGEICAYFDVDEGTLHTWCLRTYKKKFSEIFQVKKGKGRISLRRMQWQSAEKGNITMQIFLGKQFLGQSDKVDQTSNGETIVGAPMELILVKPNEPRDS